MRTFDKKHLWYLATVCGFTIGLETGTWFIGYYEPSIYTAGWMEIFFWVFPAVGAGLGMGFAQWILIRRVHKNAYLWILATTIGVTVISGGALLALVTINYYRMGTLSWLYSQFPSWFVPLAAVTPVVIFTGPFFQWLFVRHVMEGYSFRELLRMGVGWVLAFMILFFMFGILGMLAESRNDILNFFVAVAATMPSGLIFAYFTIDVLKNPLGER